MTKTFRDLGVHGALCDALDARGITHPFPIQELTLPLALEGNDLIGQARTGTGKTLAFGLPLLQRIDPGKNKTQALVIAPTRELANQVHEDLSIGSTLGLSSIVVYGGTPYEEQIEALQAGAHVVVGTPGRLLDHLNRGILDLSNVTQLVLDEADEMLDMGFLPDVERLIEACAGEDRHTMLFSATMPTAIVRLARRYMEHPTFTRADHEEKNTAPLVTQFFFQVHRMDKPRVLARILQSPDRGGVYVFVRTKHMADRLVNELDDLGVPAVPIHGDLRQTSREKNLDRFRSGKATVLVATEVAARGLDVTGVTHVINYDCPDDEKMYLHRIGRTARAGEAGVAITFAEFNEADRLNVIRKAVGATDTEVLPIFSTSQELTDLFDLPTEKPWDAQVKEKVDEEQENQRKRRESRGGSGSRGGRSDGRSKNSREREGKGDQHSSRDRSTGGRDAGERRDKDGASVQGRDRAKVDDRKGADRGDRAKRSTSDDRKSPQQEEGNDRSGRERARSGGRDQARSGDRDQARSGGGRDQAGSGGRDRDDRAPEAGKGTGGANDAGSGDERVRTRTRTRTRSDRDAGGAATSGERSSEGRQRARARSGDSRSNDRGSSSGTKGDARAKDARSGDDAKSGGTDGGDDSRDRSRARDNDRSGGSRSGSSGGGRSRSGSSGGGRSRSGSSGGGRAKGGGNRGDDKHNGGRSSGKGSGGGRGGDRDPAITLAPRGSEARGEGQPQLARRVRVDKLP